MDFSSVRRFAALTRERVGDEGVAGLRHSLRDGHEAALRHAVSRVYWPEGTPVFEEDWDVLLILDACRADLLAAVRDEYEFLDAPDTRLSVDSASYRWMEKNFSETDADELRRTAYVTGNPYSDDVLNGRDFRLLDEVWKYEWDDDLGTIHPRPLTDRAIAVARDLDPERLIVHYMQPHYPFIRHSDVDDGIYLEFFSEGATETSRERDVWTQFREGELTEAEVRELYLDNLRYVLDDVELLLENVDADTVVLSADHGNAFGEFGVYGHPPGMPFRSVREVPWYTTSATDTGVYVPETEPLDTAGNDETVDDRLRDLGYL
jgi:hypothetical protein